jgi:metal-responsive CopG/Arc/MetJ family transcriptional regulator
MQKRQTVGISFDNEILNIIDKKRGFVPRSRFVEEVMRKHLEVMK